MHYHAVKYNEKMCLSVIEMLTYLINISIQMWCNCCDYILCPTGLMSNMASLIDYSIRVLTLGWSFAFLATLCLSSLLGGRCADVLIDIFCTLIDFVANFSFRPGWKLA